MPIDVKNLPHDGYSERENSDAINQIIQLGGMGANVYGGDGSGQTFTVPAGHFETTGPFRVNDPRVKPGSFVGIDPINIAGIIATVGVTTVGDGFFEVNDPPPELMFAAGSLAQNTGVIAGGLFGGVVIPFDTLLFEENLTIAVNPANRITSKIIGIMQISLTISGIYAQGRDYQFGITKFDIGDNNLGTFLLHTSTSNQNDTISVSGLLLDANSNVGDYYIPLGSASGANITFTYDLTMTFQTISPARGVIVTEEVTYNYVIIQ